MRKAFAGLVVLFAAFCATAHASDATRQRTELRLGVDPTYAPFESKAPSGKLVGLDIDLGNEICRRLKTQCVWVETAFDGIIPALQSRKFDAIMSALSVTKQREMQIAFSSLLYNTPSRLIGKTGSGLTTTPASLKGKRIGVATGSTQEAYAKAYWAPAGIDIVSYTNQDLVNADLLLGRIDGTLTDEIVGNDGFLKLHPGAGFAFLGGDIVDEKTLGKGIAMGLRKDDSGMRQKINAAIAAIMADGTFEKIERQHFAFDIASH